MNDLVSFLRARLDEDEQAAKAVPFEAEWTVRLEGPWQKVMAGSLPVASGADAVLPHIARHDPARVLREVDRDRQIIDQHGATGDGTCRLCLYLHHPCITLRLLALPYASHGGYHEEWRP